MSVEELNDKLGFVFDTNPLTISEVTVFSDGSQRVEERSYSAEAVEIFEMGYYLVTGTTPEREGWIPRIYSKDQYDSVVDQCCEGDFGLKRAQGFCCLDNPDGLELIIRGDRPLSDVILTLAHEAGHARQKVLNPTQSEADNDTNIGAIREAEAFAFEVALVRALGKYTRLNVSRFPDIPAVRSFLDNWAVFIRENANDVTQEHDRALYFLWLAVLTDPALADARRELETRDVWILSYETLFSVHTRFIGLQAILIDSYVDDLLKNSQEAQNFIIGTITRRLQSGVPLEGFIRYDVTPVLVP